MKMQMLLTRKTMYAALLPYTKGLTEQQLWPLDFESESQDFTEDEMEQRAKELEASMERWKERDAKRKEKAAE